MLNDMVASNIKTTKYLLLFFITLSRDYWPRYLRVKLCQKNSKHYRGNLEILYVIKIYILDRVKLNILLAVSVQKFTTYSIIKVFIFCIKSLLGLIRPKMDGVCSLKSGKRDFFQHSFLASELFNKTQYA